jgi:hypothetical protein
LLSRRVLPLQGLATTAEPRGKLLWSGARKPCGLFSGPRPWPSTPRSKTCSIAASQFFGRRCRRSVAPTMATKMFGSSGQSPLALACTRRPRLCSLWSSQGRECAACSRSEWHGPARSHLTLMGHEFFTAVNTAFARAWRHATVVPQLQSYNRSPWCGNSLYSLAGPHENARGLVDGYAQVFRFEQSCHKYCLPHSCQSSFGLVQSRSERSTGVHNNVNTDLIFMSLGTYLRAKVRGADGLVRMTSNTDGRY